MPGTRVVAETKQNIISKHFQVLRLNMDFDDILRRMRRRRALDQNQMIKYRNPSQPEWYRIFTFLQDVIADFSWTQFLAFKNVLKVSNRNLYLVVFKDRECDATLFHCITSP